MCLWGASAECRGAGLARAAGDGHSFVAEGSVGLLAGVLVAPVPVAVAG